MHPAIRRIAQATEGTPYETRLWQVGGSVRDELMGRHDTGDLDIVYEGDAVPLAKFLIEKGLATGEPAIYPRFGTAMIRIENANVEFASARKESYGEDSRKPNVKPATLLEDARRRDFTLNALMRNVHSRELLDLLGNGLSDLEHKILRTPLDPAATFFDDPLRMLRAVRFRFQLGAEYAPNLPNAIRQEAHRLQILSAERIRDEWTKMLLGPDPAGAMRDLLALDLLKEFAPEFLSLVGCVQGSYHHLDAWDHTLLVLKSAHTQDLALALACLMHDIAKPQTRSVDENGRIRFLTHERVGEVVAQALLRRLRFSSEMCQIVPKLIRHHMRFGKTEGLSATAIRRLIRDLGDDLDRLMDLCEADAAGQNPELPKPNFAELREKVTQARIATPPEVLNSPLSGKEIMELLQIEPGLQVGRIKARLTQAVLCGEIQPGDKAAAIAILQNEAPS